MLDRQPHGTSGNCGRYETMAEILMMLNVSSVTDAKKRVGQLCKDAIVANSEHSGAFEFEQFSMTDHDFNKAFFDGHSSWNDGACLGCNRK
jgi:hypothetical protein